MENKKNVLYIEDNEDNCALLTFMLEAEGYQVTIFTTAAECFNNLRNYDYSAIILDNRLPDGDGLEICREIRKFNHRTPIAFFTADARSETKEKARRAGANACLIKPNDLDKVVSTVNELVTRV